MVDAAEQGHLFTAELTATVLADDRLRRDPPLWSSPVPGSRHRPHSTLTAVDSCGYSASTGRLRAALTSAAISSATTS